MCDQIQFFHERAVDGKTMGVSCFGGETFCVELPKQSEVTSALSCYLNNHFDESRITLDLKVGSARCHPKDRYAKKTGNKIAIEHMKSEKFFVDFFDTSAFNHKVSVYLSNETYQVFFTYFLNRKDTYPRLHDISKR